jgi:cation-transporting ATPase E
VALLTIGVPSFFLALAPNAERFRQGFIPRVVRFSVPAGLLAGVSTLLAYQLARHEQGLSLPQERTTAVMTLIWVGLGVLTVVAAPLTPRRLILVWSMAGAFPAVLLIPWTREFFELRAPPLLVWLAAIGIAALVWSLARLFVPGPRSPMERG